MATTNDAAGLLPAITGPAELRSGLAHWIRSYFLMIRWELTSLRLVFPLMLVVQLFMGAGLVIGFALIALC